MEKRRASNNKWCVKRIFKNFKILLRGRNGRRSSEPCAFSHAEQSSRVLLPLEPEQLQMLEHKHKQQLQKQLQEEQVLQQLDEQEPLSPECCDSPTSPSAFTATSDGNSSRSSTCASVPELEDTLVQTQVDEDDLRFWRYDEPLDFLDEWTIERRDLSLERVLATTEKETVYRAYWHGSVTVHTRRASTEREYQDFVSEVQTLCRIRHEKIQLFMGVCFDLTPDRLDLAIVVDQMRGDTLHNMIHKNRTLYDYQSTMSILNQVAQGMEYLHAKSIAHPLLTSKSIGIYRGRACITISITVQELTYIPPEVLRTLVPNRNGTLGLQEECSSSYEANVYSFGTVAYEMATMERPYRHHAILPIIWEVGNGRIQPLTHIGSWKLRGIVASCWTVSPRERDTFEGIVENIERNMTPNSPRPYAGDVKSAFSFSEPSQLQRLGL
ncbi:hypothetical protein EMCRGX_G019144 [Ephydatia muelleri]